MKKTGDVIRDGIMLLAVPLICIVIVSNFVAMVWSFGDGSTSVDCPANHL